MRSLKQQSSSDDRLIVIGVKVYNKNEIFEPTGHLRENFYREEIFRTYSHYQTRREHLCIYKQFKERYLTLDESTMFKQGEEILI